MSGATTPITVENISSLKVVDLRHELDKRGLEKSGLKADLVKRLEKSLLEESVNDESINIKDEGEEHEAKIGDENSKDVNLDENTKLENGLQESSSFQKDESEEKERENNSIDECQEKTLTNVVEENNCKENVTSNHNDEEERNINGGDEKDYSEKFDNNVDDNVVSKDDELEDTTPDDGVTIDVNIQEVPQGHKNEQEEIGEHIVESEGLKEEMETDSVESKDVEDSNEQGEENVSSTADQSVGSAQQPIEIQDPEPEKTSETTATNKIEKPDNKPDIPAVKNIYKTTSSEAGDNVDVSKKEGKSSTSSAAAKGDSEKKDLSRCIWISGLASITKAADLKSACSTHGKVIGAKVVTSAKTPGSQCFGFVTMATEGEAKLCIEKLNKTTLHEKVIRVEKAKTDPTPPKKPSSTKGKPGEKKSQGEKRHSSSRSGTTSRREDKSKSSLEDVKTSEKKNESRGSSKSRDRGSKPSSPRHNEQADSKSSRSSSKEKERVKSIEQLRRERAEKIEREHQLREERRRKEREKERQLRDERRKEQEKREKERRERARREAERVRKEREKQRELEKQRERERERERERFIRERKEREEKERKERERERERLQREREERERLDRERRERERLENERIERERQERERLEKERLAREERQLKIERERKRLEEERLERERLERERSERGRRNIDRGIDRGLTSNVLKRPGESSLRSSNYYSDSKRERSDDSRKNFFGSNREREGNYVQDDIYDSVYKRTGGISNNRSDNRSNTHSYSASQASDIRRVVHRNDSETRTYMRERSRSPLPRRSPEQHSRYRNDNERSYSRQDDYSRQDNYQRRDSGSRQVLEAPHSGAPKTLSDVLGRAGLTGILGNQNDVRPRDHQSADNYSRRSYEKDQVIYSKRDSGRGSQDDRRDIRPDVRRDDQFDQLRDNRYRVDEHRSGHLIDSSRTNDRRERYSDDRRDNRNDSNRRERNEDRRMVANDRRDFVRSETRHFDDRDRAPRYEAKPELQNKILINQPATVNLGERRQIQTIPPTDIGQRFQTAVMAPRIVPLTDILGRALQPLPAVSNAAQALQAGYAAAAQNLAFQQAAQTNIQVARDGRFEYARIQPGPQPHFQPRFH